MSDLKKYEVWNDSEEYSYEAENRIKNIMWTVSGDYRLSTKIDMKSYSRSVYISMYDAMKQGGFSKYFDSNELAMYLVKKIYYGGEEKPLAELAQLCVDAAVYKKIGKERPGIPEIRQKAFADLLEYSFGTMSSSLPGKIKIALLRGYLDDNWVSEKQILDAVEKIRSLEESTDTMDLIKVTDALYNTLIDRRFEKKHGDLEHVLSVTMEDLKEFSWQDFLEEELGEELLEEYLRKVNSQVISMKEEEDQKQETENKNNKRRVVVITEEALKKMYSYMEHNYGVSYLSEMEQKRQNQRICRGAHADCSLYYTEGILRNPVKINAQYVNAQRGMEKNKLLFRNSRYMMKRSIEQLTDELKRSLYKRNENEQYHAYAGQIIPQKVWKIGRMDNPGRLFLKTVRHNTSEFVVDILMDASGSQRDRQSQVALQAYIISESLSNNRIPHRIMSFCSFWDYTVLHRFREYDDPRSENARLVEYVTSANNRDGLAIRAAGDGLLQRPEEGKILIVLSDGRPNDIIANRPNSKNPKSYYGEYAVMDTAFEIRKLRNNGVCVLGVFTGKEEDLLAEKKIYGKDFAYIHKIEGFSKIVGRYLRKLLEDESADYV